MNFNEIVSRVKEKKFLLILLVVGIVIMLIPGNSEKNNKESRIYEERVNRIETEKLEKILKKIQGVRSCEVFITYDNQGESNFAYDISSGSNRQLEIKLSDDEPLIKSVSNPKIRGIFVSVEGRANESEIVKIIKAATGAPMHRIYVKISEGE